MPVEKNVNYCVGNKLMARALTLLFPVCNPDLEVRQRWTL